MLKKLIDKKKGPVIFVKKKDMKGSIYTIPMSQHVNDH